MQDLMQTADQTRLINLLQSSNGRFQRLCYWLQDAFGSFYERPLVMEVRAEPDAAAPQQDQSGTIKRLLHENEALRKRECFHREFMIWTAASISSVSAGDYLNAERNLRRATSVLNAAIGSEVHIDQ